MPTGADEIAPGYRSEAELSPGTHRCVGPDGRTWVLKRLPDDCLHAGGLHPAIRERLARIRELPHARVATLAGVVRGTDPAAAFLVWAFVDGQPIDRADLLAEGFAAAVRGLASAVETLHARGLVHGGLTAGNVILTPAGDVWLTHLSPYLWDDPAEDVRAVLALVGSTVGATVQPLPDADGGVATDTALRTLAAAGALPCQPVARAGHPRRHRNALLSAAAVAIGSALAAWAVARWAGHRPPVGPATDGPGSHAAP